MATSESSFIYHPEAPPPPINDFKGATGTTTPDQRRLAHLEENTRRQLEGVLNSVRVGGFQIAPWKLKGLHLKDQDPKSFAPPEITDPRERMLLTKEAIDATHRILQTMFIDKGVYKENFVGMCDRAAALIQELLAHVGVRVVLVYGVYHAQRTERYLTSELKQPDEGIYGHWWAYESQSGRIPPSTADARQDIIIVDPTRIQFEEKPLIVHPDDGSHQHFSMATQKNVNFRTVNKWLWNDTELEQWRVVLNDLGTQETGKSRRTN